MKKNNGFSLMEMMVVLLITAIVAAAAAPMVNKKMLQNMAENGTPWVYLSGTDNSIAYNLNSSSLSAIIGAVKTDITDTNKKPRLFIKSNKLNPHITFSDGIDKMAMRVANKSIIITDNDIIPAEDDAQTPDNSVFLVPSPPQNATIAPHSVAIGSGAQAAQYALALGEEAEALDEGALAIGPAYKYSMNNSGGTYTSYIGPSAGKKSSIAIGKGASSSNENAIALGYTFAKSKGSIAIGYNAFAGNTNATTMDIAIGNQVTARNRSIAIGLPSDDSTYTEATGPRSMAIGLGAKAEAHSSIAIGDCAKTAVTNQIVLGTNSNTVYIPGNLVVGGKTYLGVNNVDVNICGGLHLKDDTGMRQVRHGTYGLNSTYVVDFLTDNYPITSDRRLKNVGKAFVGGLEEVKKLEVFNYTFKKDETKTPRVGVMAQDLEKIFPNAVIKGEDGFLRIRMEDMFYAVVNSIKELDKKLNLLEQKQKRIDELEARLDKLEKRLEKLEKKSK